MFFSKGGDKDGMLKGVQKICEKGGLRGVQAITSHIMG